MHNYALRDALLSTKEGKQVVDSVRQERVERTRIIEAKRTEIGNRVRALKELAFATFMGDKDYSLIPEGGLVHKRPDVFFNSKDNMREIGRRGGKDFENAMSCLKFAYNDFYTYGRLGRSYRDAIESILPSAFDRRKDASDAGIGFKSEAEEIEISAEQKNELAADIQAFAEIAADVESSDGLVRHQ